MKVPKYIEKALEQRAKAATKLIETDCVISDFIRENDIEAEYDDYQLSVGIFENPYESSERVKEAILKKGE